MTKVLIVDDEKIVRVALRAMVDWLSEGFEVWDAAGSGEAALESILAAIREIPVRRSYLGKQNAVFS